METRKKEEKTLTMFAFASKEHKSVFNAKPDKITNYLQNEDNRNKQKILITSEMTVPELGEVIEGKIVRI